MSAKMAVRMSIFTIMEGEDEDRESDYEGNEWIQKLKECYSICKGWWFKVFIILYYVHIHVKIDISIS